MPPSISLSVAKKLCEHCKHLYCRYQLNLKYTALLERVDTVGFKIKFKVDYLGRYLTLYRCCTEVNPIFLQDALVAHPVR